MSVCDSEESRFKFLERNTVDKAKERNIRRSGTWRCRWDCYTKSSWSISNSSLVCDQNLVHYNFTMEIIKYRYLGSGNIECSWVSHQPILCKSHILKGSLWTSLYSYQSLHHLRIAWYCPGIWNYILHIYFIACHSHVSLSNTIRIDGL